MNWKYFGLAVIAVVVLYLIYVRRSGPAPELLTDRTDEQRRKIADKIKAKVWYGDIIRIANDYNIPHERIAAIVAVESQGTENAVGKDGEKGLMQLMTGAVKDVYAHWGKSYELALVTGLNLFDAKENILIGTAYLAILQKRLNGNLDQATQDFNDGKLNLGSAYQNEVKAFERFF